jgi:hypothetical protein
MHTMFNMHILAFCVVLILVLVHVISNIRINAFYTAIPNSTTLDSYLREARTGDIIFAHQSYTSPRFVPHMHGLGILQFVLTGLPFTHVAVILRRDAIPDLYAKSWGIESDDASTLYVYSSESGVVHDLVTNTIKEGTVLQRAQPYLSSYNGKISCVRCAIQPESINSVCEYIQVYRNRGFNRNLIRYANIAFHAWDNAYDPAKSLCTETCSNVLKNMFPHVFDDIEYTNIGLREIYDRALSSGVYDSCTRIL